VTARTSRRSTSTQNPHERREGRALTRGERVTLAAIAERIFPATDTPGAVDAGAVEYIEIALAGAYASLRARYRRALREIDLHARQTSGRAFRELDGAGQDRILTDLEAGALSAVKNGADFFRLVRQHVLEGIFGDPQYGGNRDLVGWRIVGFPGQRTGYADAYINRVVDLPPIAADDTSAP